MSTNTKIFQLYFKDDLKEHLDPAFTPMSNVDNPRPHLREWCKWDREHEAILEQNLDLWGYVSWKFKQKTGLTGEQAFEFIHSNPGYDVYLFNPCIVNEALFANSWEQGDIHHPNISGIGNSFLSKMGYEDEDVKSLLLDRNKTVFANYVVGNRKFWTEFMAFSRSMFTEAEKDPVFETQVFGAGLSNYAHDSSLPNFTFLIERLIPTFLELKQFNSIGYTYTTDTVLEKYKPYFADIMSLSNLKIAINDTERDDLYDIWNHFRTKILQTYPQILGLE